ncbi:MAG: rod shape-determining protein MreC [Crocinitomicaceae bacterium]
MLSLFFNSKNFHKASFVNSTNSISSWILQKKYNITKHFELADENKRLADENANMLAQLPQSFYALENNVFSINDTLYEQQYQFVAATVINYSNHMRNNYATINKGALAGIKTDMGVMVSNGIVGFIIDVSDHYAIIRTILSERINLAVEVNKVVGQLDWRGYDNTICHIKGITASSKILEGDKVYTKGSNGHFPEGILLGTVEAVEIENGSATLTIAVRVSTNFNALSNVFVVNNIFKSEQKEIEGDYYE